MKTELAEAYEGRRVLVTGHTGFKGAWLVAWLRQLGAEVHGYALAPDTEPALFDVLGLTGDCDDVRGDVRDYASLAGALERVRPDYVFHLAAQPLVRRSYEDPLETISTNVMGSAHLLEAIRKSGRSLACVVVTSDKCYENAGGLRALSEEDAMGGHDVYSMSKGATELLVSSYRRSFFSPSRLGQHGIAVASARAGNVIGGGDWARDRIVPDAVRALRVGEPVPVRNPSSTRPWQHVLEPLSGYLKLGARLARDENAAALAGGWNFGPDPEGSRPVRDLVDIVLSTWGGGSWDDRSDPSAPHEAPALSLSIAKAKATLDWHPRWGFDEAIRRTIVWYRAHHDGAGKDALRALTRAQITDYMSQQK
ncbi:MAG TPA: CDP-glucose 4,6-dehydratase [Polyangiaceae bacterium]|jgi:CDP-glucose 4,6-dehydratase|nr:CDP-glucose 4,6-dehydratase [Polyangiaceae bacterium]